VFAVITDKPSYYAIHSIVETESHDSSETNLQKIDFLNIYYNLFNITWHCIITFQYFSVLLNFIHISRLAILLYPRVSVFSRLLFYNDFVC